MPEEEYTYRAATFADVQPGMMFGWTFTLRDGVDSPDASWQKLVSSEPEFNVFHAERGNGPYRDHSRIDPAEEVVIREVAT